jgi:protein-S-isoprenylcysteine O-methyltransferase Ste14
MSAIAGRDHKISWITARTKIIYFAVWLIPFVMSAFSDRRFFSLSGRFVHFIAEHSIVGVAALLALVVFIFGKSLNNKSIKVFFWLVLLLDCLATLCMAVGMWSWVQYGYARSAIYGEEAVLYNALFWLPLFKIFGVTPSLSVLIWTGRIFSISGGFAA